MATVALTWIRSWASDTPDIATTSPFTPSGAIQTGIRPMKNDLGVNQRQLRTFAELRGQPGLLSSG